MTIEIRPGNLYLFKTRESERMLGFFPHFENSQIPVLCVTRFHPDRLREDFGVPQEKALWLSNTVGARNVNPQNVGILTDHLIRFYESAAGSVVLFDGLEYLLAQNDFNKVLRFVNYLYEAVAVNKGILILTIDPRAFSTKELAFLERNAVPVEEDEEVVLGGARG